MVSFDGFEDEDWRATLAELRLLVITSGFGDWDAAMVAAIEEEGSEGARRDVQNYAERFAKFLKIRHSDTLSRISSRLGELLVDEHGQPILEAKLSVRAGGPQSITRGHSSDRLIEEILRFVHAVGGETGYFRESEPDE